MQPTNIQGEISVRATGNQAAVRAIEKIVPHPDASLLNLAYIGQNQLVVRNDRGFKVGTLGVYIPVGARIPQYIADSMELGEKLAGPKGTKQTVQAVVLRGQVSEGLFWRPFDGLNENLSGFMVITDKECDDVFVVEGEDVTKLCGIE